MLFRVLNLSTLIYSKFCECEVLYCALIFHECDVVPFQYEGIWFFCGFWFRSAYNSNTLAFRTLCFLVPPCFQYDPFFLCMFYCSTLMHHFFSNLREHFLLRSITFWFFEADAVFCVPSFTTCVISSLVILMRLPVLRFLMNSMCRPSKMEYDFYDAAGY